MGSFSRGSIQYQVATTATAAGTTTLTATSLQIQYFTGTSAQTIKLPPTTSMVVGQFFEIFNGSTGTLTMQYQDGSSFTPSPVISAASSLVVKLVSAGTTDGTWVVETGGAGGGANINTIQKFTSGSGTYTTPANVIQIRVRMVGGGGGGSSGGNPGNSGSGGGTTTFGTSLLTAFGGGGGTGAGAGSGGGTGASASISAPAYGTALSGGDGGGVTITNAAGSAGGSNALGGAGIGNYSGVIGQPGKDNTGSGGGGGGSGTNTSSGSGGGAGGFIDALIPAPSSTYSYSVGAAGSGGGALGTPGYAGGAGGSGYIEVTEYYANGAVGTATNVTGVVAVANGGTGVTTSVNPAGSLLMFAGSSAPAGTLLCDGLSHLTANYPALFAAIGYTYGGSGANFNVPDYRGLFLRGVGTNATALQANGGAVSGAALGTLQNDMIQGHYHGVPIQAGAGGGSNVVTAGPSTATSTSYTQSPSSDGTNGTARYGAETRPANLSVTYCIWF
jgi:microcystin-dependent protein